MATGAVDAILDQDTRFIAERTIRTLLDLAEETFTPRQVQQFARMGTHFSQLQSGMVSLEHRLKTPEPIRMILLRELTVQDRNRPFLPPSKFPEEMSRGFTNGPTIQ